MFPFEALKNAIRLVDNLPVATPIKMPNQEILYDYGYRLGFVKDGKTYVNNHLAFKLHYHEYMPGKYRVVGFEVQPSSRDYAKGKPTADGKECPATSEVRNVKGITSFQPQLITDDAKGILWTYSVDWSPSDIPWASRWDVYLAMKDVQIHWFSIINSIVVVMQDVHLICLMRSRPACAASDCG